ncbi:MAG: 5-methyltetrahydropteroyltriglutamate--homocysteine S-methyltransferase [Endomicrobium sp.]|jgi:5-methyltetrahydropteroyltriglutamate--homocysteine methyltransferase|nr:5-methyltetrahydropteroyltriglutamate--homocysteine S-methyltransferase [Endomicrobium sp.]
MSIKTLITGFPRIGEKRELKKALESYWSGAIKAEQLHKTASQIRQKSLLYQKNCGIDLISVNDFSLYDNMLDTAVMLNAVSERFKVIENDLDRYFAMARGNDKATALEMTKWFNTNYHYIVPELNGNMKPMLNALKIISEYKEAKKAAVTPKINIIGPVTFLGLSKNKEGNVYNAYFDKILSIYKELLSEISKLDDIVYVQFEEPLLVKDTTNLELTLLKTAYTSLSCVSDKIKIIVTSYFEHSTEAVEILTETGIWAVALDFVYGKKNLQALKKLNSKKLIAGVVDGRNVWINDIDKSVKLLDKIAENVPHQDIIISTSCSLLHVPYALENEPDSDIKRWLSFAYEKVKETVLIAKLFHKDSLSEQEEIFLAQSRAAIEEKKTSCKINDISVQTRVKNIQKFERGGNFKERNPLQKKNLNLPLLPTTTIGSYPQTDDIRSIRKEYKKGNICLEEYESGIKKYIDNCVAFQDETGLDVLVHGEPERNDMVEYFGEMLKGFHFTTNAWVQSYGSRCVKPPIIYGDISRPQPMTVKWITYAQSKTKKAMKGMLTGPVTILNWSFVRDDKPRNEVSKQIALALSDEINDLQQAGIKIIQVDEAAFKEGYPIRKENIAEYEKWAVENFKLAVSTAKKETQIHTHMCYSEFNEIVKTIEAMDADVLTIETTRSGNELLNAFKQVGYKNEIGPGVYDIHSPRIPQVEEFADQIRKLKEIIPVQRLWINPDCGLKTRKWEEVKPALKNMVEAVKIIRDKN